MTPEIDRANEDLVEAALKWADASARDPEEVETETRELRVKLLDKAWHLRSVCRDWVESSEPQQRMSGGERDE